MRVTSWTLVAIFTTAAVSAQSLGDVARKEKERREKNERSGVSVRVIGEDEIRRSPAVVSRPASGPGVDTAEASAAPALRAGVLAPDFSLPDRSGRSYSLADFRGRPLLIDFWATWCGPCRETMPEVEALHKKYRGRLQVVGINIEGRSPDVFSYLDRGGYSFQVLFDSGNWDSVVATRFGVSSIPRSFLIDRDGRVLYEGHPSGLSEERIQAAITAR